MLVVACYSSYLGVSLVVTVLVARMLERNGRVFLVDAFRGKETLADSVNRLLVVGFYLVNVGYIVLALKADVNFEPMHTVQDVVETAARKIGFALLIVGILHFVNIAALGLFRFLNQLVVSLGRRHSLAAVGSAVS